MASSSCLLSILFALLLCFLRPSSTAAAAAATFTLSLSPFTPKPAFPTSDPYQLLNQLSVSSRARALNLRRPKKTATDSSTSSSFVDVPLFSHSYGAYSMTLRFGTPPQSLALIFDTGSSLVWFPCTSRYVCSRCSFPEVDPAHIPTFIPRLSSSARILGCSNPKCGWLYSNDVASRCGHCSPRGNCTCPPYIIQYGSGNTGGVLLSETIKFPGGATKTGFVVGCSVASTRQPAGIAGFGRSPESLPAQLGARRFSYCLQSRNFDDTPVSSDLVLVTGSDQDGQKTDGVSYTRLLRNPDKSNAAFQEFYYVLLRKITVGEKAVKLPYKYLEPGADGNGGTIVDSGSTFTFMEKPVFEIVTRAIEAQMSEYPRSVKAETKTGLRPCFNVAGRKKVLLPTLGFQFKGGAEMVLPLENYFPFVSDGGDVCFTVVTDDAAGPEVGGGGPAIILGSFQQQNFYLEFDLQNERFGFRKQNCSKH